ncbi:hypothetical protein Tco_0453157 [Tanacetum coccineum]
MYTTPNSSSHSVASVQAKLKTLDDLSGLLLNVTKALNKFAQVLDSASSKDRDQSIPSACQADTMPAEGGAYHKGKKEISLEESEKETTNSDSNDDDETHVTGSMVEPSITKKLKKFDFITEDGRHVHLIEEEINHQKKLEEDAKAEAAKQEREVRKDIVTKCCDKMLVLEVVNKYYNDKLQYDRYCDKMLNRRAESRITNCDVLTKKGLITLKVYREDGTSEVVPNFKANDLHLGEWIEKRKHADDIHDYFKANKRLKSSVQYEDHLLGTVLNEPVLGMIMFNSYHRQDFVTIEDLKDFSNTMLYTIQEIFFRRHQGPGLDDHARTFSSLLLAEVDKRNLNLLKQMRTIEQLRQ